MNQLLKQPAAILSLCLIFIFGICLLVVSVWLRPYHQAMDSLHAGALEESFELFVTVESRFDSITLARQVFPEIYFDSIASQFYILYTLGNYDDLLEKSATSPVLADVHFWTGNTLFRRTGNLDEPQEQVAWLERASDEYRKAIELAPDDWNSKFNYEMTNKLIDELKEEKETPPQIMEILRPRPQQGEKPFQQTG